MTILPLMLALGPASPGLTLGQAVALARDSALAVQVSRARIDDDRLARRETTGRLLPRVALEASQVEQSANLATFGLAMPGLDNYVPFYSIQDVRVAASLPLVDATLWSRLRESRETGAQRSEELASARAQAALQGALAWIETARAEALVADREEGLRLARALDSLTEQMRAAGGATRLDAVRAESQVAQASRALSAARQGRERARLQLGRLLGIPAGDTLRTDGGLSLIPATDLPAPIGTATPAERSAQAARRVAERAERTARADDLPVVSAFADYGYIGTELTDDGEWTGKVGVRLEWELFDLSRGARTERARIRTRIAQLGEIDARRASEQDENEAASAVAETAEQLRETIAASALADTELTLAEERFRAGASGNLEVVQAQGARTTAHAAWIDAAGAHRAARARLRWARDRWDGLEEEER